MIPMRAISMFHATVKAGSISSAAQELGVTPSAISQQIHSLELFLGTSLMVKVGRQVKLTEAGERYFEMISNGVDQIAEATHRLRGHRAATVLTVRAAPTLSTKWLLPRLGSFIGKHPQIDVRIDGTNEPTNFDREDVDVDLRHGEGRWPGLFVEGLAEERFFPVCSPSIAAAGSLQPADFFRHRLIHSVKSAVQWNHWFATVGISPEQRWQRVLFDRSHMVVDAAAGGLGIALESNMMMWHELRDGRLVCPVPNPPPITAVTQWIVCPPDRLRLSKVRSFIEWLRAERDAWLAEVAAAGS